MMIENFDNNQNSLIICNTFNPTLNVYIYRERVETTMSENGKGETMRKPC